MTMVTLCPLNPLGALGSCVALRTFADGRLDDDLRYGFDTDVSFELGLEAK
jgi:hypothetical protein